jgi:hypothetical protein
MLTPRCPAMIRLPHRQPHELRVLIMSREEDQLAGVLKNGQHCGGLTL